MTICDVISAELIAAGMSFADFARA